MGLASPDPVMDAMWKAGVGSVLLFDGYGTGGSMD